MRTRVLILGALLAALFVAPAGAQTESVKQYQYFYQERSFTGTPGIDTLYFGTQPAGSFGVKVPDAATRVYIQNFGVYAAAASAANSDFLITQGGTRRMGSVHMATYAPSAYNFSPPLRFLETSGDKIIFTYTGAGGAHVLWYQGYWTK